MNMSADMVSVSDNHCLWYTCANMVVAADLKYQGRAVSGVKTCSRCKLALRLKEFNKDASRADGLCPTCRKCRRHIQRKWDSENKEKLSADIREWKRNNPEKVYESGHRLRVERYGLTVEDYRKMNVAQSGLCAICKQHDSRVSRKGRIYNLAVDHSHESGKVRGLLCGNCNTAIGLLSNINLLEQAKLYMERYKDV